MSEISACAGAVSLMRISAGSHSFEPAAFDTVQNTAMLFFRYIILSIITEYLT